MAIHAQLHPTEKDEIILARYLNNKKWSKPGLLRDVSAYGKIVAREQDPYNH